MLFPWSTTEGTIIETVGTGHITGPILLEKVTKKIPISKESFYRLLRKLLKEEIIVKNKTLYSLHSRWIEKLSTFCVPQKNTFSLEDGDQITRTFKDPKSMYQYWANMYDSIIVHHHPSDPILIYHPHNWFVYGRTEDEQIFLERFKKKKQYACLAIGGKTVLDKKFKKEYENEYVKINIGTTYNLPNTTYINVVGDYIFKVTIGEIFSSRIDTFFNEKSIVDVPSMEYIEKITSQKEKTKILIKRSKKEATIWRTKYRKYFIFPKSG